MTMRYTLVSFLSVLLMIVSDTNALSVNILPKQAVVNSGEGLTISSTITKSATESWKTFVFRTKEGTAIEACRGAAYSSSAACNDIFGCTSKIKSSFTCNYTHFNLLIDDINISLSGLVIYAEVTYGSSGAQTTSNSTTIQVNIPLKSVSLTPNGTITKTESETQEFQCSAKSLPVASLTWRLNGSVLSASQMPVPTTGTITSIYTFTAKKDDNGKRLSCTAVYYLTEFTEDVLINVLCK